MALLIKHTGNYKRTLPAYRTYDQAKKRDKEKIFQQHESSIIIHEAASRALKNMGISGKLPDAAVLKQEQEQLSKDKSALYKQYGSLKKQVNEYTKLKQNIDSILGERTATGLDKTKVQQL